ncbi:MAG: neutral/alkaline non-lysosomal ceramidase N-terminal domain-containing protein [Planctomycetota bacterium]
MAKHTMLLKCENVSVTRSQQISRPWMRVAVALILTALVPLQSLSAAELRAGAAKVDVTNKDAGPANDPLYVKALVITDGTTTAVIATVDAVAIAEIGSIRNDYLSKVRTQLQKDLGIVPANVMINASHCHGVVCTDIEDRTVQAVKAAYEKLEPVTVGVGRGSENRVMENRRLKLKNGREADVRHAYSLPADAEVADVGPVDPEIGLLRLDRKNGQTLAIVYNFACHPIQGVPSGANTADMTGFASQVIEDSFGEGTIALFLQGCGGDINPVQYKATNQPRDSEPLGNLLGLSAMKAARKIHCSDKTNFQVINETLVLPRADLAERIAAQETQQQKLLQSLKGTSLNIKTFIPLVINSNAAGTFPSYYSHRYLHDRKLGRNDFDRMDAENRNNVEQYLQNIYVMEELTRVQTNLNLLKKHQAQNVAAGKRTLDVEVVGVRLGDFVLVTFPGELTVRIGLHIKKASPHPFTFVAGYTNGYIYYAPTAEQLLNVGGAQEDSDCILAPEWQELFETKVADILKKL